MARKKKDDDLAAENVENENVETMKSETETQHPPTLDPQPETLFGDKVTPENIARLAGVAVGEFPQVIALTNATSSELAFAELGVLLLPYEQKREVIIRNQGMVNTFCVNFAYLSELSQWDERYGVLVQAANLNKDE